MICYYKNVEASFYGPHTIACNKWATKLPKEKVGNTGLDMEGLKKKKRKNKKEAVKWGEGKPQP